MTSEGLLVSVAGATAEIENSEGKLIRCHVRKNAEPVITGDHVAWELANDGTGIITGPVARKTVLFRPENAHKRKLIAANIDFIFVVTAPPPVLAEDILDRYLIAAQQFKITPVIVLNKIDLMDEATTKDVHERLHIYERAGYTVLFSSIHLPDSLNKLSAFLEYKSAVLVGQSGVGKSSLIKILTGQNTIRIGDVSTSTGLGKHTTTGTRLYHLPNGGSIIDSPGVREFGLWHLDREDIQNGFLEFEKYLGDCKFRDCLHLSEPGCAIRAAVEAGDIAPKRMHSYQKIMEQLANK
ncbi:MAG: small ribosomal subunit biogenesis GTPase RsgA [Gammaproteobacteria bacterium]|nr:small ribosomal subunit biogenesis GTPase RsgA [Gammaproteobacteria bacterium]